MSNRFLFVLTVATLLVLVLVLSAYSRDDYATQIGQYWRPPTVKKQDAVPEAMDDEVADGVVELITHQPPPEKGVAVAKLEGQDTSWLDNVKGWTPYVFTADSNTSLLHPPINKGSESVSYLTFLIDFYDALPNTMAFIHYHEHAWHNDDPLSSNSNAVALQNLKADTVQRHGFVNLRCITAHACPDMIRTDRSPLDADYDAPEHLVEKFVPAAWEQLGILGDGVPVPATIASACCAQFAVSREQVHKRPKVYYERIRNWVMTTEDNDWVSGRVMEYMWHMMFGRDPVFCPEEEVCSCEVYGRC